MRSLARLIVLGTVLTLNAACGEPTRLPAQDAVVSRSLTVYALSGSDIDLPSAISFAALFAVRASGVFDYEVAFDIDAAGNAVAYPLALIAAEEANPRRVGLLKVPGTFEQLTSAPRDGYVYDQPLVLAKGDVVAVESQIPCSYPYPPVVFSKFVIDSINPSTRAIHISAVTDPSCGFRSFLPGIPKS